MKNRKRIKVGKSCNNNCLVCQDFNIKADNDKTYDEIINELDKLKSDGIKEIIFPCNFDIRKDFIKILKYAKNLGFKIILETNGRIFSIKAYSIIINKYVDEIFILYFGNNPKDHDKYTKVEGNYKQARIGEENLHMFFKGKIKQFNFFINLPNYYHKPIEIVIECTPKCNLNCQMCFNKSNFAKDGRKVKEFSTEYVKKIIDSVSNFGVKKVRFSGGEPLLRKDIFELMKYAKDKGLKVWLNTNGLLIDDKMIKELEKYVENVLIPFNGYDDKSEFEWTNTKYKLVDKLNNIRLLKRSKIPVIRGGTVLTESNIEKLEKIYKIVKKIDLDHWEVYRPIDIEKNEKKFDIEKPYKKIVKLSLDSHRLISIANSIPFCCYDIDKMNLISLGKIADDGHSRLIIDPNGFVKPSYYLNKNIGDPMDLEKAWNNNFVKDIRDLKKIPSECNICKYLDKCRGGSRYMAKLHNGEYDNKDPLMDEKNYLR